MRIHVVGTSALLLALGAAAPISAQAGGTAYPAMAPIDQYLMPDRGAEVALARSAAPEAVSRDATILVLGRSGYETAVVGSNGFVCLVERGWTGPFDWPESWNPRVRAAGCLNPQAARAILPIVSLRTAMVLDGRSSEEILSALRAAYGRRDLPDLEDGAMAYMMSNAAYLTDQGGHNVSHVMFYTRVAHSSDWGANLPGSPVLASPYWYFSPEAERQVEGLPPMLVFLVALSQWSDGTSAGHP